MSTTTEAIEIIDELVEAKIPKSTATKLVDFAERQRDKSVDRLWIAMAVLAAGLFAVFGLLWQMSQKAVSKEDMQKLESRIDKRFDRIDKRFDKMEKLILQKR